MGIPGISGTEWICWPGTFDLGASSTAASTSGIQRITSDEAKISIRSPAIKVRFEELIHEIK
jgi:hypothetical protein